MGCLSSSPVSMRVAVPYVGAIPGFQSIVALSRFLLARGCDPVQLITRPPESEGGTIRLLEANLIAQMGVEVLVRKKLHSKIYQFRFPDGKRAAFVGSANLSLGGFELNDETVAFFREKADNDAVAREFERIAGFGAQPFEHWKTIKNHPA